MSHIVPSHQVDSQGGDCTDPTTHTVRVSSVLGSAGGGGITLKTAAFTLSASGPVVPAVSGKRIKVYAYKLVPSAPGTNTTVTLNWRDGSATDLEGPQVAISQQALIETVSPPAFLFATTAGNSLDLVITGTGSVAGRVSYWDGDDA
jgi:hypothetical protein